MKKFSALLSLALLFGTMQANAATLSITPTTISVTKGQTITLNLSVDAAGTKVYTVKTELSFPANTLEVISFTQSTGWLTLSQPGYDTTDNANGKLIKTAGFTGGFTDSKPFGAVTFKAKESGSATVSIVSSSQALNAQSQNSLTGTQGSAVVTVVAPMVAPTPEKKEESKPKTTTTPKAAPKTTTTTTTTKAETPVAAATMETATTTATSSDSTATSTLETVAGSTEDTAAVSGSGISLPLAALFAAVILVIGGLVWKLRT